MRRTYPVVFYIRKPSDILFLEYSKFFEDRGLIWDGSPDVNWSFPEVLKAFPTRKGLYRAYLVVLTDREIILDITLSSVKPLVITESFNPEPKRRKRNDILLQSLAKSDLR